jgi:proteasome beta subunit
MAGDRRATAGNVVVYDRADKVLPLDEFTLLGIAGVPAFAWEMARILSHSFKYFRRSQLQELSLEGKLRSLSALLRGNLPWLMQGVGIVAPILASWDPASEGRLFTYDPLGAEFEGVTYATSGSGSGVIESILLHRTRYEGKDLRQLTREGAIALALQLLEAAADSDSATGGVRVAAGIYPSIHWIDAQGVQTAPETLIKKLLPNI